MFRPKKIEPVKVQPTMCPEDLTNLMVQQIGDAYLEKFPKPTLLHKNQKAARILKACNYECYKDRWSCLITAYSSLKSNSGWIAKEIEHNFERTFGKLPSKADEHRSKYAMGQDYDQPYTSAQYAIKLNELLSSPPLESLKFG